MCNFLYGDSSMPSRRTYTDSQYVKSIKEIYESGREIINFDYEFKLRQRGMKIFSVGSCVLLTTTEVNMVPNTAHIRRRQTSPA
jgi:hypothetical protein